MGRMRIESLILGMIATNVYFVMNVDTKEMLIVGPLTGFLKKSPGCRDTLWRSC